MNPRLSGLYAITDPALTAGSTLEAAAEAALRGGARILQYRDKTSPAGNRLRHAQALRQLCADYGALFIVNDDVMLAQSVEADGVHLGRDDLPLETARERLGAAAIIGISCYDDLKRAQTAQQAGADYVAFGRIFPSRTKPLARPASLALLQTACRQLSVPVVAIGGITLENVDRVLEAGAHMAAVIQGLFAQPTLQAIEETARAFSERFQRH